jgi:hypothetical protein
VYVYRSMIYNRKQSQFTKNSVIVLFITHESENEELWD